MSLSNDWQRVVDSWSSISPIRNSLLLSAIRFVSLDKYVRCWQRRLHLMKLFITNDGLSFSLQLFLVHICSTLALQSHNGINILLRCFSGTLNNWWQRRSWTPHQIRTIISVIFRKQLNKIESLIRASTFSFLFLFFNSTNALSVITPKEWKIVS